MKQLLNKLINIFNYEIVKKNSWYQKQLNYIAEINEEEENLIKNISKFSMCSSLNHWALIQSLKHISKCKIDGDIVEAGVYKGGNLMLMSHFVDKFNLKKKIYAYDTFEGMPLENKNIDVDFNNKSANDTRKQYIEGKWCYASLDNVKKNLSEFDLKFEDKINFIKGKVEETLTFDKNLPKKISLLRLDTDFYESTKIELEVLYPKLEKNGILIIDDYGHWKGAKKAVDEYFRTDQKFRFFHRIDHTSRLYIKE